jgi:DNA modification methylase
MRTNVVYLGDCLEGLKKLPDESVDAVITDPPFAISNEVVITRGRNKMKFKGTDIKLDFGEWDKFDSFEDYLQFTFQWLDECVRILKDGKMLISYFDRDKINFISYYLQKKYYFKFKGYFAQVKSNPVPQARKVKWMNGWEEAGLWQKPHGKLTFNYKLGQQKDWECVPIVGGKERTKHPTQKPLKIIRLFINYWTNEGDLIIDPFAGSGTTLVACKELNRQFIGFEISPEYCEIIKKRLAQGSLSRFFNNNSYADFQVLDISRL